MAHHLDELASHIPGFERRRMLDAGSGRGKTLVEAAHRGYRMAGLELSEEYIRLARERAREAGVDIEIKQGVLEHSPYGDAHFGFINCAEVIEHVADPDLCLRELYRMLEPGGYCYLSVPSRFGLFDPHYHLWFINWLPRRIAQALIRALGRAKADHGAGRQGLDDMYYDTFSGARRRAARAGFAAEDIRMRKIRKRLPAPVSFFAAGCYLLARPIAFQAHHLLLRKPPEMRVLVMHGGKLGDAVCATPVFRAIKAALPHAAVTLATPAPNREVLRGNPHIAQYLDLWSITPAQCRGFDAAILLTPSPELLHAALRARVPRVITPTVVGGYSPFMTLRYRLLSLFATRIPHRMGHYAPGEYLSMLRPLGIVATDTRKEVFVDEEAQQKIDSLLEKYPSPRVAIAPGAGNKIKEWPPERFNEVAKHLVVTGASIVIVGGPAEKELGAIVAKDLPQEKVWDTTGALSIEELKALVRRMDLFVSADTGPIYIAEAWGVPTIDIVGPMDEREQPPRGERHMVLVPKRAQPVLHIMNARVYDKDEARRQVEGVSVDEVRAAVFRLLQ